MYWGTSRWSAMEIMVNWWAHICRRILKLLASKSSSATVCFPLFATRRHTLLHASLTWYHLCVNRQNITISRGIKLRCSFLNSTTRSVSHPQCSLAWDKRTARFGFTDSHFILSGVGAMTWSPLACGLITGKYSDGVPESSRAAMKVSLIELTRSFLFCGILFPISMVSLMFFFSLALMKGYQWLKERVSSEEGRRQLAKIKELHLLADRLGCTAAQLAIGTSGQTAWVHSFNHSLCSFSYLLL